MALNKDGLEPGQSVDFETLQRVLRRRKEDGGTEAAKEVRRSNEQRVQNSPRATSKKAQKKGS